jgi:hypothetical protein
MMILYLRCVGRWPLAVGDGVVYTLLSSIPILLEQALQARFCVLTRLLPLLLSSLVLVWIASIGDVDAMIGDDDMRSSSILRFFRHSKDPFYCSEILYPEIQKQDFTVFDVSQEGS